MKNIVDMCKARLEMASGSSIFTTQDNEGNTISPNLQSFLRGMSGLVRNSVDLSPIDKAETSVTLDKRGYHVVNIYIPMLSLEPSVMIKLGKKLLDFEKSPDVSSLPIVKLEKNAVSILFVVKTYNDDLL